jgi:predicted nucleic acid-binding protein
MARPKRHRRQQRVRETAAPGYAPASPPGEVVGVLLDSDVIIDALRGRQRTFEELSALEQRGVPTYCSAIAMAEIFAGRRAGAYLSRYARSHGLEIADALVAATASSAGVKLWTLNHRHYPMPDVTFYDMPVAR